MDALWNIRLRNERIRRNWRQQDLADQLGTSIITIRRWERGSQQPSAYFRVKLCALFGKSAKELGLCVEMAAGPQPPEEAESSALPLEKLSRSVNTPLLWSVPYARNSFFTGREAILCHLHEMLSREHAMTLTPSWMISGLGGIGKTQTVLEYAYRYANAYSAVFWVSAETSASLVSSFVALADLLNLPEKQEQEQRRVVASVIRWLNSHHDWLLIFDNVEESEVVAEVLPSNSHGCLLFTSRRKSLGITAHVLDLDPLMVEEGIHFLLRRARRLDPMCSLDHLSTEEVACAREIVMALDGLPLALDQAGAYIDETECTLIHYRTLYQRHRKVLLDRRGYGRKDHPHSVMATLSLSMQEVKACSPAAADLLCLCAFVAPDAIPEELFLRESRDEKAVVPSLSLDMLELDEVLAVLRNYSLIKRHANVGLLSVHRMVQTVLREQMDQATVHYWVQAAIGMVNQIFPEVEAFTTWSQCQRLLSHALVCATLIEEEHSVSIEAGRLLHQVGAYLLEQAQYAQAEICLTQSRAIREQLLGDDHPDVAESLNYEAELAYYKGQYAQAEQLHLQALHMRQRQLTPMHPAVATSLHNLAGIYWIQGRYEQAEPLYWQSLQIREEALGRDHLDVGETLQNIAYLLYEQERYAEAEPLYQRALKICLQVLGPDHAYLITLLNNIGKLCQAQGKYEEASDLYQQASALCNRVLDALHPYRMMTLSNLARLAYTRGELEQAETMYQQVLQIREHTLGPDHPHIAQSLYDLAILYSKQAQTAQASWFYQRALAIQEKTLGPDHPASVRMRVSYTQIQAQ